MQICFPGLKFPKIWPGFNQNYLDLKPPEFTLTIPSDNDLRDQLKSNFKPIIKPIVLDISRRRPWFWTIWNGIWSPPSDQAKRSCNQSG